MSRINFDQTSIDEVVSNMKDLLGGTDKERNDQFVSILLFECIKSITYEQAIECKGQDPEMLNAFTPEYLKILNLDYWSNLYLEKKVEKIEAAFTSLADTFARFSKKPEQKDVM